MPESGEQGEKIEQQLEEQGIVVEKVQAEDPALAEKNPEDWDQEGEFDEDEDQEDDNEEGWINAANIDMYLAKSKDVEDSLKELNVYIMSADYAL